MWMSAAAACGSEFGCKLHQPLVRIGLQRLLGGTQVHAKQLSQAVQRVELHRVQDVQFAAGLCCKTSGALHSVAGWGREIGGSKNYSQRCHARPSCGLMMAVRTSTA